MGVETMTVEERMQGTHEERWEVESSKRHSDGGGADERLLHIIFIYIYIQHVLQPKSTISRESKLRCIAGQQL